MRDIKNKVTWSIKVPNMSVTDWICHFDNESIPFKLMFVGKISKAPMLKEPLHLTPGRPPKFWNQRFLRLIFITNWIFILLCRHFRIPSPLKIIQCVRRYTYMPAPFQLRANRQVNA